MTGPRLGDLGDEQVDAELTTAIYSYDPADHYPEWSNAQMRDAYRAGRDDAIAEARSACAIVSGEQLDALPDGVIVRGGDGAAWRKDGRFCRVETWWVTGSEVPFERNEIELPGQLIWHPDWSEQ